MKTLIINGSPRKNGDTSYLINLLKHNLQGEVVEVFTYYDKITACLDCRYCWKNVGCCIKDSFSTIIDESFDNIIVASPVFMGNLTPPTLSLLSRFNYIWSNNYFFKKQTFFRKRKGALILVGGGNGAPDDAIKNGNYILKKLNAIPCDKNILKSLNTDNIPIEKDEDIKEKLEQLAKHLNN